MAAIKELWEVVEELGEPVSNACPKMKSLDNVMQLLRLSKLDACITGSAVAVVLSRFTDVEEWASIPDVDVFCYSPEAQVAMIQYVQHALKGKPGKGSKQTAEQEQWKIDRCLSGTRSKDNPVCSVTLQVQPEVQSLPLVNVNITYKKHCTSLSRVLESFDMNIVMIGIDVKTGAVLDLRGDDVRLAERNKLRRFDMSMWNVAHWVRQWDRVLKYYSRGFDTRPMAEFYLEAIDRALSQGKMWTSEKYLKMYDEYTQEFTEMRERINEWLKEHNDD